MTCDTYYGGFRTRTFADIFPDFETFSGYYDFTGFNADLRMDNTHNDLNTIYYLLYARYGNSHISYSDENQFIFSVFSTIFMYGPTWSKRLDIQEKLRGLTEDELMHGSKAIHNQAFNPGTAPSTQTLEELTAINQQATTNHKKSKIQAYVDLYDVLATDVTKEFIDKFARFFIKILAPDYPLLYKTYPEDTTYGTDY